MISQELSCNVVAFFWVEHYEFDDLKKGEEIKLRIRDHKLKVGDTVCTQSCFKDEDTLNVEVVNIIHQVCNEKDIVKT